MVSESGASTIPPDEMKLVFVDQTKDARDAARLAAEHRLNEEVNTGGWFNRTFKRVWKESMWKEYYTHKYERQALTEINQTGSTLAFESTPQDRARATQSVIDRFQNEEDSVIHEDAGEKRDVLGAHSDFAIAIKDLIAQNVRGEISDQDMIQEKNRILAAFAEHSEEYKGLFKEGSVAADNMIQVANAVKTAVEHGESLDEVMRGMGMVTGEARNSVRTEVKYSRVDKMLEKLNSSKVGSLVQPETLMSVAAIAQGFARLGGQRIPSALLSLAPPIMAGTWAGIRENKRVKDERRQHAREMAMGGQIEAGSRRRQEMETARYESVTAQSIIDDLNGHFNTEGSLASDEAVAIALAALFQAEARNKASDNRQVDLIAYSSAATVGEERFALDLAIAQAKVTASQRIDDSTRQRLLTRLGLDPTASIADMVATGAANYTANTIDQDMSAKDAVFQKLKARRVATAAAAGALTSFALGMGGQEARGLLDSSMVGLGDILTGQQAQSINGNQHETVLYSLLHGGNSAGLNHIGPGGTYNHLPGGHIELSSDATANIANGEMQILDGNGKIAIDHVPVNADGTLPQASIDLLRQQGFDVDHSTFQTGTTTTLHHGGVQDYLKNSNATDVKLDYWYDNDTPQFDKNELNLWYSGVQDTGIDPNGHFAYSVDHMTADGSTHQGQSAHWKELLQQGKLKVALSVTGNTQSHALIVDIKPDGSFDIDPNSPAGQLFENRNGHAVFKGAYMRVVEDAGTENGATHIRPLATVVGENSLGSHDFTWTTEDPTYGQLDKITTGGYDVPEAPAVTEVPIAPPIVLRRPLELLAKRRSGDEGYGYGYAYDYNTPERMRQLLSERSPRLAENPEVQLNPREELDWYHEEIGRRWGEQRVEKIEQTIQNTDELRNLPPDVQTIVTVPVGAAFESENIFQTLSLYAQQDVDALAKTVILLNVNWLDTATNDPDKREKIKKTIAEIERARLRFPELHIAVIMNEYEEARVKATGGVIGYAASDMVDTALMALRQNMAEGKVADDQEVGILRNDADMDGMSRHYLKKYQEAFAKNPLTDIFRGITRFGVKTAEKYPGWGIATDFTHALVAWSTAHGGINTGGANNIIRASTFAAVGGLGDVRILGSGAGSDDTNMGLRIAEGRTGISIDGSSEYGSISSTSGSGRSPEIMTERAVAQHVSGVNIDTNVDRLLPRYLRGEWWQGVWRKEEGSFNKGPGGYGDRTAEGKAVRLPRSERLVGDRDSAAFQRLEQAITYEITYLNDGVRNRLLAMYFRNAPAGAYTLESSDGGVKFRFTAEGRKYVSQRVARDGRGRRISYGQRKTKGLYRPTVLNRESALVEPLTA